MWISTSNLGQKLMMVKWFHIWCFGNWGMCWPNIWNCTWNQIRNFTWIIFWRVDPKWICIFIRIGWCNETRLYWITDDNNNGCNRWSITVCLWNNLKGIFWCLYWWRKYWMRLISEIIIWFVSKIVNDGVWVLEVMVGHQMEIYL